MCSLTYRVALIIESYCFLFLYIYIYIYIYNMTIARVPRDNEQAHCPCRFAITVGMTVASICILQSKTHITHCQTVEFTKSLSILIIQQGCFGKVVDHQFSMNEHKDTQSVGFLDRSLASCHLIGRHGVAHVAVFRFNRLWT